MSTPSERLAELGLQLPQVVTPLAAYVPSVITGNLVHTSGQLPIVDGVLGTTGKLGAELDTEAGYVQARICALNALAALAAAAGGLDAVERIIKVTVFVASTADYSEHPKVANGASDLFGEVFGDNGRHARSAVGVAALPLAAPVEVEVIGQLA